MTAIEKIKEVENNNFNSVFDKLIVAAILELAERLDATQLYVDTDISELYDRTEQKKSKWVWKQDKSGKVNIDTGSYLIIDRKNDDKFHVEIWFEHDDHILMGIHNSRSEARAYIDEITEWI